MNQPAAQTDTETTDTNSITITETLHTTNGRAGRTRRYLAVAVLACVGTLAGVLGGSASPASASATGGFGITAYVNCYQSTNTVRVNVQLTNWSTSAVMFRYRPLVWDYQRRTWVRIGTWISSALSGNTGGSTGTTISGLPDGAYDVRFQVQRMSSLFPVAYTEVAVTHDINIWAPNGAVYKAGYCSL